MSDIQFYRARVADFADYLAVERSVMGPPTYSGITDQDEARQELAASIVYFITVDGKIAGTIQYEIKSPKHAHISGIVVRPEFQERGVGHVALHFVLKELKSVERIDMAVHPHNRRSLRLALNFGFVVESWQDNYFGDGEPRLILVRPWGV
ncbi:GNAT family N-acetyltransferase [Candidatus Parcubacteria bacterium]|nr:MAG: GNAT family N-acetyltransferase [Candidatus Parcubacteria bacterium]